METIILAGGFGTRLGSRLTGIPKPMAPVAGRPFLQILLDRLVDFGCERTLLSVGYLRDVICEYFGNSYRGMPLHYVIEEIPLGTGGAIQSSMKQINSSSVLILNGDTYLKLDYAAMFALHNSMSVQMTMAVTRVENVARYGGVIMKEQRVIGFTEKENVGAGWINAGVYILSRDFSWPPVLPSKFSFETDVLAPFLSELSPVAFLCNDYFLDIGIPEDLDKAQRELAGKDIERI